MAKKARRFGAIRKLPSGLWQARYRDANGVMRAAPHTFSRQKDADAWLARIQTEMARGEWVNPDGGKVTLGEYADAWLREHPKLSPKTRVLYGSLLKLHIRPQLGVVRLVDLTTPRIRTWRHQRLTDGVGAVTVAKAYRLLRGMLNTAVTDRLIPYNPCVIKGAGKELTPERPVATVAQVFAIADAMPARFRTLVLLATFASLRWGELAGLRRRCVDLDAGTVRVEETLTELDDGSLVIGPPKSEAGRRTIVVPAVILNDLRRHLARFTDAAPGDLVFTGAKGAALRRSNFQRHWTKAAAAADVAGLHFHDLRHTGNTLAAMTGPSLRELMARMGHASSRAALIYQHATAERDRAIADGLSKLVGNVDQGDDDDEDPPGVPALVS